MLANKDPMRMTMGQLGFTENEMYRTKYLVDKVSGKFNIDKRYLAMMPEGEQQYLMGKTGMSVGVAGGTKHKKLRAIEQQAGANELQQSLENIPDNVVEDDKN